MTAEETFVWLTVAEMDALLDASARAQGGEAATPATAYLERMTEVYPRPWRRAQALRSATRKIHAKRWEMAR